jgi:predicted Zn-dependent protease
MFIRLSLSLLLLISINGCTINTDVDKKMGAESSQQITAQMGIYQKDPLSRYVDTVGQRLVRSLVNPEFTFQFQIVDDATPNAFALPGGYIYISRGLLALVATEDELANILGHEITHVTERHSIKQMQSRLLPSLIELPGNLIGGIISEDLGALINTPISMGSELISSGYSRGHESEADEKGIALAAKAGYQPQQMSNILLRLNSAVELSTKQKRQKSYFDSHPYTPDRVSNINELVKQLTISPTANIEPHFSTMLKGLLFGDNPAQGTFIAQKFLQPKMGVVMDFPTQWEYANQPQAVIATYTKEQAFVVLATAKNNKNAYENTMAFQQRIKEETGKTLNHTKIPLTWGGTGYLISFNSTQQERQNTVQILWVDIHGQTYQVSSVGSAALQNKISASMRSLRPMLNAERKSLTKKVIAVVQANNNDSLVHLTERENNTGDINYIRLINNLSSKATLLPQQEIKIIVNKPYTAQ